MCARSATSSRSLAASSTLAAAVAIAALAVNLPPHGFYSGDSGVKLVAAVNAVRHPATPFDIVLPRIQGGGAPYPDRFYAVHGDHGHALQSPVFPLLIAPFVHAFGSAGAYVLPAISFVALVPLLLIVRRAFAPLAPEWLVAVIVVAANPVVFYALELWEHVPAVALLAAATAFSPTRPLVAGLAAGVAILLRPEAAWYAAGLLPLTANWKTYALGGAAAVAPFAFYNLMHSGNPLGPHAAANLAPLSDDYIGAHIRRTALWLVPSNALPLAGFAIVAAAHAARFAGVSVRKAQAIALGGTLVIAYAAIENHINRESLWRAWPLATLLLVPGLPTRNRLWIPAGVAIAAVLLLSTHDGGAQWGPRFLLIASPALIVLASDAAARAIERSGEWFSARAVLVGLLIFAAVFTSRDAYRELRATKQFYARINEATARGIPPGTYVISRVWWFDQITAPLYGRQPVLAVDDEAEERAAIRELEAANVRSAVVVMSDEEGERRSPPETAGTCFTVASEQRIDERALRFIVLSCPS